MPNHSLSPLLESTLRRHLIITAFLGRGALVATTATWTLPPFLTRLGFSTPWQVDSGLLMGGIVLFLLTEGSRFMYETHMRHMSFHHDDPLQQSAIPPLREDDTSLALPVTAPEWRLHRLYDGVQAAAKIGVMIGIAEAGLRVLIGSTHEFASAFATPLVLLSLLVLGAAACADVFLLGAVARRDPPAPQRATHRIDLARWSRSHPPHARHARPTPSSEPIAPSSVSRG
ncbi:MAG: hypothetical protein EOM22_13460 [Gammaproteobacteria bacterium]|nr:hypothetical protein [Gammaproteobacteria bacterium]